MKKTFYGALAATALVALAPAANAALTITPGTGVNNFFITGTGLAANFDETATFTLSPPPGTLAIQFGDNPASAEDNVEFISAFLNGAAVFSGLGVDPGEPDQVSASGLSVNPGLQTLRITGTSGSTGQFSGTITFAPGAVPEPSTWAMMLIGFGAIGYSLRRRSGYQLAQAV